MKGISQTYAAMKIRRVSLKTDLAELIALDVEFKGDAENDEGTGNDKDVEIADGDKNDEKAENGAPWNSTHGQSVILRPRGMNNNKQMIHFSIFANLFKKKTLTSAHALQYCRGRY